MNNTSNAKEVGLLSGILRRLKKVSSRFPGPWPYKTDQEYWEERYLGGGTSGHGSIGGFRDWKWKTIDIYVDVRQKSVLDVGCGDLSFWNGRNCSTYVGVDFSEVMIERNRTAKPDWGFILGDVSEPMNLSAQVVFCFDVLYHVMLDESYIRILNNLSKWTKEWLFVYTLRKSMFRGKNTDGMYQCYRPFINSIDHLAPLKLVNEHPHDKFGSLYVFRRDE